jgi:hypothetical protein
MASRLQLIAAEYNRGLTDGSRAVFRPLTESIEVLSGTGRLLATAAPQDTPSGSKRLITTGADTIAVYVLDLICFQFAPY